MKDLKTCREMIDTIDRDMMALFEKRMAVVKDVVLYKQRHGLEIFQSDREQEVIAKAVACLDDHTLDNYARVFIKHMMDVSKQYQKDIVEHE